LYRIKLLILFSIFSVLLYNGFTPVLRYVGSSQTIGLYRSLLSRFVVEHTAYI